MSKRALQSISENQKTQNTILDLTNCELVELPSQLLQNVWLKELYLNFNLSNLITHAEFAIIQSKTRAAAQEMLNRH